MATPDLSRFGAVLKAVSDSDTAGREQIEYIDIDLLDGDPRNFYALPNIAELAENILLVGLQQPAESPGSRRMGGLWSPPATGAGRRS